MTVLTNSQLFTLRNNIINNNLQKVDSNTLTAFNILAISGLRIQELYNIFTAEYQVGNIYLVYTLKGSFPRLIDFGVYAGLISDCVASGKCIFLPQSKPTVERNFFVSCNYTHLYVGQKGIETHYFRHCLIKELYQNGNTISQIKAKFGLSSGRVVEGYINSQIYTK